MAKKNISKKWPIAISICWLAFYASCYIATIVGSLICIIRSPETYRAVVSAGWLITLFGTIYLLISFFFMVAIHTLSKKAGIKWMAIISKIYLFACFGSTLLYGIATLTYL